MKLKMNYNFLNADITLIEKELEKTIQTDYSLINETSLHYLRAGGKRIRPVLVLLAGKFGNYNIETMKSLAVALELLHMATLVHDDVIDDADTRRGQPTVKAKWDNRIAMYTGDYILARSLELMATIKNVSAHQILSKAIVEVCLGEVEQIKDKYNLDQNLRTYLRRIKRKTALLIAVSCQLGAIAAGVPEAVHKRLFSFGYNIGMAFQITDDILDFTASAEQLGKPAGSDLLQGNITLPVLYAMKNLDMRHQIDALFQASRPELHIEDIIRTIKLSGAIEESAQLSHRYLQKAMLVLKELPSSRSTDSLYTIAKFIGSRKF